MRGKTPAIMMLAVVAGCSIPITDTPAVAIPPDRDNGAVVAALRQINPCALIDPAIASRVGIGAQPVVYAKAPHACTISSTTLSGADDVSFRLGSHIDHFIKWSSAPITLTRAKAYVLDESLERDYCAVFIPVSFERAIEISTTSHSEDSDIDVCAASTAFAEAAAVKLADPDSLRTDRQVLPLSQWDGCSLLATALGEHAGRYTMTLDEGVPGLDECDAATGPDPELSLRISYSWDPAGNPGANRKQVAGQTVDVAEPTGSGSGSYSLGCQVRWSNGPASTVKLFSDQILEVMAPECPQAEQLAAAVMSVLDATPPTATAQRPLLYRPYEPDTAAVGPCIDDFDGDKPGRCAPYREVTVPHGGKDIIAAAAADPNVECAVALAPVRAHLGESMTPTTDRSSCRFLEPTHAIRVEVDFSDVYVPDRYGTEPDLYQNRRKIDISGHPAIYFEVELENIRTEYHIYASPRSDTSAPGFVHTLLSLELPRGTPSGTPIDTTRAPRLEKIMADLMSTHFAG